MEVYLYEDAYERVYQHICVKLNLYAVVGVNKGIHGALDIVK